MRKTAALLAVLLAAPIVMALQRPTVAIGRVMLEQAPCDVGSQRVEDGPNKFLQPHHELGFLHLRALKDTVDLAALEGQVVMAVGRVDPAYAPQTPGKPCKKHAPWRPDQLEGKRGPRTMSPRTGALAHVGGFLAEEVATVTPLAASLEGKEVLVRFTSPVQKTLPFITLTARYEPCTGNAGRKIRTKAFPQVGSLAVLDARFPPVVDEGGPHVLTSIWVATDDADILFDLDWPVPPGLASCPKRAP